MILLNPLRSAARFIRTVFTLVLFSAFLAGCGGGSDSPPVQTANDAEAASAGIEVLIDTSLGEIGLVLDASQTPVTVENFLSYVDDGHYDGTIFHRVIAGFMIQGGGYTETFEKKPTEAPIANEAANGQSNDAYTIAMARTSDPHSAAAQFFINAVDNSFLNHNEQSPGAWGYAVFGTVTTGHAVVDQIAASATGASGPFQSDVPVQPVVINSINRIP